jgi:predicted esterase
MLALDTALHCEERVGGAVLVSGFLMDVNKWGERLGTVHRNIKVLQLHGKRESRELATHIMGCLYGYLIFLSFFGDPEAFLVSLFFFILFD